MRKKIMAAIATLMMTVGLVAIASPAQASVYGCADGHVCVYNYESFNTAGGIYTIPSTLGCHVMPVSGISGWTNGKVYNATTSILVNWTGGGQASVQRQIEYFDSNTCDVQNDYWFFTNAYPGQVDTSMWRLANLGWNDRIGSIKIV